MTTSEEWRHMYEERVAIRVESGIPLEKAEAETKRDLRAMKDAEDRAHAWTRLAGGK